MVLQDLINARVLAVTKVRFEAGNKWRFGPDWPGQRCGAKTRKAPPLPAAGETARRALSAAWRRSAGPRTEAGLARLAAARTTHGRFTKKKRLAATQRAEVGRQIRAELKELETWFVVYGHLDKTWRDWFK